MKQERFEGYDIIGDIHGCGRTLMKLLEVMGYRKKSGIYQHPKRQAVFVGDIVDRGPHIRRAMQVVYDMVTHGHAQMVIGNHEYNVYCHATPAADLPTGYLKEHSLHNTRLVTETFEQFANYPRELDEYLKWFSNLPLFLEFDDFRVVHACWDQHYISEYLTRFGSNRLTPEIIKDSAHAGTFEAKVVDRIIRGTSIQLPNNDVIRSRDGFERRFFRTKFWAEKPQNYSDVVYQPDPLPAHLLDQPLSEREKNALLLYPPTDKPVFFGHYWLHGRPAPVKPNIGCLDYSAVKYGRLVAYRMDGEQQLDPDHYVWLYVDPPEHHDD